MAATPGTGEFFVKFDPISVEQDLISSGLVQTQLNKRLARLENAIKESRDARDSFEQIFARTMRQQGAQGSRSGGKVSSRSPQSSKFTTIPKRKFPKKKPGVQTFSAQSLAPAYRNDPGANDRLRALSSSGVNRGAAKTSRGLLFSESGFGRSQVPGFSSSSAGLRALRTRTGYIMTQRSLFGTFGRSAGVLYAVQIAGDAFQEWFKDREERRAAGETVKPLTQELVLSAPAKLGRAIANVFLNTIGTASQAAIGSAGFVHSLIGNERAARAAENRSTLLREGVEYLTTGRVDRIQRGLAKNEMVDRALMEGRNKALDLYDDFADRHYVDMWRMGFGTEKAVRSFLDSKREKFGNLGVIAADEQLRRQGIYN